MTNFDVCVCFVNGTKKWRTLTFNEYQWQR